MQYWNIQEPGKQQQTTMKDSQAQALSPTDISTGRETETSSLIAKYRVQRIQTLEEPRGTAQHPQQQHFSP